MSTFLTRSSTQTAFQNSLQSGELLADVIKPKPDVKSNWIQVYYDIELSPKACYARMEEIMKERGIGMKLQDVMIREAGFGTDKREYLKVHRGRYTYYICAAPLGNTFFFSYWLQETSNTFARLVRILPLVGKYWYEYFNQISFHKADSYAVFHRVVLDAIMQTTEEMTQSLGVKSAIPTENKAVLKTFPQQSQVEN